MNHATRNTLRRLARHTMPWLVPCGAILLLVLASACGGKKPAPADELDQPTTMPREQVLYRDARQVFIAWMDLFEGNPPSSSTYDLLSRRSRERLNQMGVNDNTKFGAWFAGMRASGARPFTVTISRLDILDIDITDTNAAKITAGFLTELNGQRRENTGVFHLVRETDSWRVPFGEAVNWEKSWCELDKQTFAVSDGQDMPLLFSQSLNLAVRYPISWDVTEDAQVSVPAPAAEKTGIQLVYRDPVSNGISAIMLIAGVERAKAGIAVPTDTAGFGAGYHILKSEQTRTVVSGGSFSGRLYWLIHADEPKLIVVFAGVNDKSGSYSNFSQVIDSIIASIQPKL